MSSNVREWLAEQLTELLPDSYKIIDSQRIPDTISTPTVILKHLRMERLPEAPTGHIRHTVTVTLVDPHEDQAKAEDALDDNVAELVAGIDTLPGLTWTLAEKVLANERYLGWDITLTIIAALKE